MAKGTYEMSTLRKEDLSLYLYIKNIVLRDFIETEQYIPLALMPELCELSGSYVYEYQSDLEPSPTERGRGWVYFDTPSGTLSNCMPFTTVSGFDAAGNAVDYGVPEQSNSVKVYETINGSYVQVPDYLYMIDYVDGRIITDSSIGRLTNPVVTFDWHYVSVVDEWAAIEAADPPVVVIDTNGTDKVGYQLGSGKKVTRKVEVHIFASNPAERNDIVEALYDGFYNKSCPIFEFPTGSILDYDGTFYGRKNQPEDSLNKLTYLFDRKTVNGLSSIYFDSVTSRHVNLPLIMSRGSDQVMLSDLNAYRSKVSFDMFHYNDTV